MSRPPHDLEEESNRKAHPTRRAEFTFRLSEFEVPPVEDCLIIGRRAAIGPAQVHDQLARRSAGRQWSRWVEDQAAGLRLRL